MKKILRFRPFPQLRPNSRSRHRAFSLVEVTMAIGLVTFTMMVILGILPIGLQTVHDSAVQQTLSKLSEQIRADLQHVPFNATSAAPDYGLDAMKGVNYFYNREGVKVTESDPLRYFQVSLDVTNAVVPGAQSTTFNTNLRKVALTAKYPLGAKEPQTNTISLLVARQDGK